MQQQLRQDLTESPPLPGSVAPRRGDLVAALFAVDGLWYRAKIEKIEKEKIHVLFVDYGNVCLFSFIFYVYFVGVFSHIFRLLPTNNSNDSYLKDNVRIYTGIGTHADISNIS